MHCKSCEAIIKDALDDAGVKAVASANNKTVEVEFDEKKITKEKIQSIIESEGYEENA